MPQSSGYLQKCNRSIAVNFWRPLREHVLNVAGKGHRLVASDMVLNPLVDVKRTLDGILWANHQLGIGKQTSGQHTDAELLWVVDERTQGSAVVRE